jgi:hypothetical protein
MKKTIKSVPVRVPTVLAAAQLAIAIGGTGGTIISENAQSQPPRIPGWTDTWPVTVQGFGNLDHLDRL